MKHLQAVCFLCAWSAMVFAAPQGIETEYGNRIAVLDIQGRGISRPEAETITNYMRIEVAATGSVTSVYGTQIREVLSDMGLEETGCASPECALEVGKLLGASHVVIGSVIKSEQTYDLDFRMFNIETGSVQKTVQQTYQGDVDELIMPLQRLVWDIMDLLPPPERFPEEKQVRGPVFVDGDQPYTVITGAVISDDAKYYAIALGDVSVTNRDDDIAGIVVDPTGGLTTTEAGSVDMFTVVLTSEPTAEVTLSLNSSAIAEGIVTPAALVFDAGNWSTPQPVTVTGIADDIDDGDQTYSVVIDRAVSGDPKYSGLDPDDVEVTNLDQDESGIEVFPTAGLMTSEAGRSATFKVRLTSKPSAEVSLSLVSKNISKNKSVTFTHVCICISSCLVMVHAQSLFIVSRDSGSIAALTSPRSD